jgi:hypothetical protein
MSVVAPWWRQPPSGPHHGVDLAAIVELLDMFGGHNTTQLFLKNVFIDFIVIHVISIPKCEKKNAHEQSLT